MWPESGLLCVWFRERHGLGRNPSWCELVYSICSSFPLSGSCSLVFYRFAFIVRYLLRYSPADFFCAHFLLPEIAAKFKPSAWQWTWMAMAELFSGQGSGP